MADDLRAVETRGGAGANAVRELPGPDPISEARLTDNPRNRRPNRIAPIDRDAVHSALEGFVHADSDEGHYLYIIDGLY